MNEYKKILKDDRDWDYAYILNLLIYQLERTRKCIVSNNIATESANIGKQISTVEKLSKRVVEDDYYEEISKNFRKKYGTPRLIIGKKIRGHTSVPVEIKYTKETPQNSKLRKKEFLKLVMKADRMKINDLKKAFALIEKHIWGWGD